MGYQVWVKDEYAGWSKKDYADIVEAKAAILEAVCTGHTPLLTTEVQYSIKIDIKEGKSVEVNQGKAELNKSAGAEGKGSTGRGDAKAPKPVDK